MKHLKKTYLVSLLSASLLLATGAVAAEKTLVKGTSIGKYAKPGAPVDITFISQSVEAGEISDVTITLSTSRNDGEMSVTLKSDRGLTFEDVREKTQNIRLVGNKSDYSFTLHMRTRQDGVYYVKLLVSIDGEGSRVFAVPVFVGEGRVKKSKSSSRNTSASGEKISVSKAVESVE